jgi:hypothetical protein
MSQNKIDRRCFQRELINRQVDIIARKKSTQAKIIDISTCGLGLLSEQNYPVNSILQTNFCLPGYEQNNPLQLQGVVARNTAIDNHYLIGIEFLELSKHESLVLKEFLNFHQRFL